MFPPEKQGPGMFHMATGVFGPIQSSDGGWSSLEAKQEGTFHVSDLTQELFSGQEGHCLKYSHDCPKQLN